MKPCHQPRRRRREPIARAVVASLLALPGLDCRAPARPPGPIASALIATAADLGGDPAAIASAWSDVARIADQIAARRRHAGDGGDPIAAMNAVVYDQLRFEREITDDDPRFFALDSVVAARRGTCLGLSALYLALGERTGFPLDGIMLPGHFFARTREPTPRNIELLRRGEVMPDAWYRGKYGPWPEAAGTSYFRPVTIAELEGVHWYNAGNHQRRLGDGAAAERAYQRAVALFPALAEAHASLGSLRQLRGALDEAEASYREAARLRPDLPGLRQNRELLDEERRRKDKR